MDTKNFITLKEVRDDKEYLFQMENGAPLGITYDVVMTFASKILSIINEHTEQMQPQTEPPLEEGSEE